MPSNRLFLATFSMRTFLAATWDGNREYCRTGAGQENCNFPLLNPMIRLLSLQEVDSDEVFKALWGLYVVYCRCARSTFCLSSTVSTNSDNAARPFPPAGTVLYIAETLTFGLLSRNIRSDKKFVPVIGPANQDSLAGLLVMLPFLDRSDQAPLV